MQQLRATTKSLTCPPLSVARYSFIQLSQQRRQWRERKCPIFDTVAKQDSNPGSLDCESGILPLSYRAPYRQLVHSSTCLWACPECNHFNFSNSFFDDTEILTSNQFDPLDNVNRIKTKNPQSSKNGRNNKGHNITKRSNLNLRCILINCQSIRKKAADIEVLNSLHKPDFICGTESWLNSSIKNGEIFPTSFNVFRKDRETSTIGGGVFQISNEDLITSQLDNLSSNNGFNSESV